MTLQWPCLWSLYPGSTRVSLRVVPIERKKNRYKIRDETNTIRDERKLALQNVTLRSNYAAAAAVEWCRHGEETVYPRRSPSCGVYNRDTMLPKGNSQRTQTNQGWRRKKTRFVTNKNWRYGMYVTLRS